LVGWLLEWWVVVPYLLGQAAAPCLLALRDAGASAEGEAMPMVDPTQ